MSGITLMLASGGPNVLPGGESNGPLACTIDFSGGAGPFNVVGATGNLSGQGYGILRGGPSGGVPPYTESITVQSDASGKIWLVDNGLGADTIGYHDFSLGQQQSFYLRYNVTDSVGVSATARFPEATTLTIKRTG